MTRRVRQSKFMGRTYAVQWCPPGSIKNDDGELWGETDHNRQLIRVETGLAHDKERAIVLHETLHQILSLTDVQLSAKAEEKVCTVLGEALIGHMRDNPEFWRYILRKEPNAG